MAESLANKVLKLDSLCAEAYAVLGNCKRQQLDWVNAENFYRRAIELNPGYATAHLWYKGFLLCLGRFDEALKEIKLAQELDPLSLVINVNVGITYHYMRQYDKAIDEYKKTLEIYPNSPLVLENLGVVYEKQNKLDEAMEVHRATENWVGLARVYARSGKKNEAVKILDSLLIVSKQGYAIALGIASIYHAFGDKDKTFEWLTRAFVERQYEFLLIKSNPRWDDLRTDPRYYDLLKKLRLVK
jgi:tetratricopeptide (TPR) repeat protein